MTIPGAFKCCFSKQFSLLLVFGGFLFCQACSQEPILLGFSAPLTGTYSDLDVQGRNGVSIADVDMAVSILQIQNATFTTVSRIPTGME